MDKLPSPCVRNCCLDDDDICLGCGRSYQEILAWHEADAVGQQAILTRANQRLADRKAALATRRTRHTP